MNQFHGLHSTHWNLLDNYRNFKILFHSMKIQLSVNKFQKLFALKGVLKKIGFDQNFGQPKISVTEKKIGWSFKLQLIDSRVNQPTVCGCVCVCVCVHVREYACQRLRERERERVKESFFTFHVLIRREKEREREKDWISPLIPGIVEILREFIELLRTHVAFFFVGRRKFKFNCCATLFQNQTKFSLEF